MTADHRVAEPGPRRPSGAPLRPRLGGTTILGVLWVAVIVLAVAVDLAK